MGFSFPMPVSLRSVPATLLLLATMLGGCATGLSVPAAERVTVTGDITVRGNEPFTEVVLITDDNNWYLLDMTSEQRDALMTPARATITGPVRLGEWNGRPFARLRVDEIVLISG